MQNVGQSENQNLDTVNVQLDVVKSSTQSSASSPAKSETETYSELQPRFMTDSSESEEDSVSEGELEEEGSCSEGSGEAGGAIPGVAAAKFLLPAHEQNEHTVDPETQARLEALLEAAGIGKLSTGDGKHLADPEVLRRLTSSVSCALDEAAAALTRMRCDPPAPVSAVAVSTATAAPLPHIAPTTTASVQLSRLQAQQGEQSVSSSSGGASIEGALSLAEACSDGDVGTVRKLLTEGRSVHETTEEGESLLSLACSAGYYELAQVLLAMHASVEDRGIKGDCTPLMEAASAGHADIVRLLVAHGADVNAQSATGNTPLMYACAGGHASAAAALLDAGANVEDHNENGHTPLMEAASAGHVAVARVLLERGAGINTHSNEFKESALTLACYKGHLDMVRFLLAAGADREHKTDEMHTALMEASMDGHVEVARLLLDSGAQVNMPTDSFESPLTLAACGGHVELAMLLLERGANIEEVNDEGYTPLMEAAREGHEEMVALLLGHGAAINAQTEETQETALTLACCGGFLEVADFLIKAGADLELGASTPLMEAAQEGHMELLRYLLESAADVHAQTSTCDTALSYACENGHTDAAELLLRWGAELEHESEGGRTPLMKACRAGHLCTAQFLVSKGASVNRSSHSGDHTPLSLACTGGHLDTVKFLLAQNADPLRKLKDNSTMLIEAAKGGHTAVVQLLLDYPHSVIMQQQRPVTVLSEEVAMTVTTINAGLTAVQAAQLGLTHAPAPGMPHAPMALVPHPAHHHHHHPLPLPLHQPLPVHQTHPHIHSHQQHPPHPQEFTQCYIAGAQGYLEAEQQAGTAPSERPMPALVPIPPPAPSPSPSPTAKVKFSGRKAARPSDHHLPPPPDIIQQARTLCDEDASMRHDQIFHKQQILEELERVELQLSLRTGIPTERQKHEQIQQQQLQIQQQQQQIQQQLQQQQIQQPLQQQQGGVSMLPLQQRQQLAAQLQQQQLQMQLQHQQIVLQQHQQQTQTQPTAASAVSQNTAIQDRPKAKPVSKKEGKNGRKAAMQALDQLKIQQAIQQQAAQQQALLLQQQQALLQQHLQMQYNQQQQQCEYTEQLMDAGDSDAKAMEAKLMNVAIALSSGGTGANNMVPGGVVNADRGAIGNAQDLASMLEYLQREVPSLVHLPPLELRSLVLQVMQQKSLHHHKYPDGAIEVTTEPTAVFDTIPSLTSLPTLVDSVASVPAPAEDLTKWEISLPTCSLISSATEEFVRQFEAFGLDDRGAVVEQQDKLDCVEELRPMVTTPMEQQWNTPQPAVRPPLRPSDFEVTLPVISDLEVSLPVISTVPPVIIPAVQRRPNLTTATQTAPPPQRHHQAPSLKKKGRFSVQRGNAAGVTTDAPPAAPVTAPPPAPLPCIDVDGETESNRDTALTLACAGGHEELVELLLSRGANIEHRDKKGFTPLILAATAGHEKVAEILLNRGADLEAQSERTKDTPLSLACSGGRYEVVELALARGANKEHRNVSDYTPLSLAASGGYVNIIRLLLSHQAEINSRTGSKLGISPLMLAAMNGHTAAVRLLLDMGSDINAQIETNRNTALTLACFQGRHEVVSLLLDRKANVEHRAKTGLTPLMEAASGGYVEVGRVLLDKGADVNAPPVPSSRDTALTIAADKGHTRFVELLLQRAAAVEVKNKKGNSPLWLAANGGHLSVVEMLYTSEADIDSQDNRKVSCLMAAFRKGHVKVVKWMVGVVTQFPSDQEMTRYVCTLSDKELLDRCHECVRLIRAAKETQAARANKNATILLEELDAERVRQESRRAAAQRRKERKKKKRMEKKEERRKLLEENEKNCDYSNLGPVEEYEVSGDEATACGDSVLPRKEEGDSGIDANSQGSCSSSDVKSTAHDKSTKAKKKKKGQEVPPSDPPDKKLLVAEPKQLPLKVETKPPTKPGSKQEKENVAPLETMVALIAPIATPIIKTPSKEKNTRETVSLSSTPIKIEKRDRKMEDECVKSSKNVRKCLNLESHEGEPHYAQHSTVTTSSSKGKKAYLHDAESPGKMLSPKQSNNALGSRRDEGWKEVVRKSSAQALSLEVAAALPASGTRKVAVPAHAISRVIGRAGSNINAIRAATTAHIDVDKQARGQAERIITIKGSAEATRQAHALIAAVIRDPDADVAQMLSRTSRVTSVSTSVTATLTTPTVARALPLAAANTAVVTVTTPRTTVAPRLALHSEKRNAVPTQQPPKIFPSLARPLPAPPGPPPPPTCPSSLTPSSTPTSGPTLTTFAAKLTSGDGILPVQLHSKPRVQQWSNTSVSTASNVEISTPRPQTIQAAIATQQPMRPTSQQPRSSTPPWSPARNSPAPPLPPVLPLPPASAASLPPAPHQQAPAQQAPANVLSALHINTHTAVPAAPQHMHQTNSGSASSSSGGAPEYSLFNHGGVWGRDHSAQHENHSTAHDGDSISGLNSVQVDVSKAPGYRGSNLSSGGPASAGGGGGSVTSASPGSGAGSPPAPPSAPPVTPQPPAQQITMHSHHNYHQYADVQQGLKPQSSMGVTLSRSTPVSTSGGNNLIAPVATSVAPQLPSSNSTSMPPPPVSVGNGIDISMLRNGPNYPEIVAPRSTHIMMTNDYEMLSSTLVGNNVNVGGSGVMGGRLNPRAPDYMSLQTQNQPTQVQTNQHHQYMQHNHQVAQGNMLFAGGNVSGMETVGSTAGLSALLNSNYQQQHHYQQQQSMMDRNGGVRMSRWDDDASHEERKPRPIGTERASWKLTSAEWEMGPPPPPPVQHNVNPMHLQHIQQMQHHINTPTHRAYDDLHIDRYQASLLEQYGGAGGATGATAAALSLMHAMPHAMHYLDNTGVSHPHHQPPPHPPHQQHHWDVPPHLANDKQGWTSKWTH